MGDSRMRYKVLWARRAKKTRSYRVLKEDVEMRTEELRNLGFEILPDPFRKGAPAGGYKC